MRKSRVWAFVASSVTIACLLSGCVDSGPDSSMTLSKSKSIALATEKKIADLVPSEFVADVQINQKASLLSCKGGGYTWPGEAIVHLQGNPDLDQLAQVLKTGLAKGDEVRFAITAESDGTPRVQMSSSKKGTYIVGFWKGATEMHIASSPPCFQLSGGNSGGEY